jgi:N-acetylglucosamine-6-phosphate deacetylase
MSVLTAAAVVTPDSVLRPGWVRTDGDRLVDVGGGRPAGQADLELGDVVVVPGFVDVHCHGGGGAAFGADPVASSTAAAAHLAHGTTSLLASLVTGSSARMQRELAALAGLVADGVLDGVHLEGPWLSTAQCGAHDPTLLRAPDPAEVDALVGHPAVRMVTIAPELPGAIEAVRRIAGLGAVAAVGHTDADLDTTRAAIAAGATHATHLFNAMRPLRHRDPGPVLALLEDPSVSLEVIRDGVHLDPDLCAWLDATVPADRLVAVTDAMAAAAGPDGSYLLGELEVVVEAGVARVRATGAIAGSTATMDRLFRSAAGVRAGRPTDATLVRAARQTATNPARVIGLADRGHLAAGARADLVVLDPDALAVRRVMRAGRWITTR